MKRQGLQRLACPVSCETGPLYSTVANIETRPLPLCGECGSRLVPESLELAARVLPRDEFEQLPAFAEYLRTLGRKEHGKDSWGKYHMARGTVDEWLDRTGSADEQAFAAIEAERREAARVRQLAGLVQYRVATEAAAEIPF